MGINLHSGMVRRLGDPRFANGADVFDLAFSPDGNTVASTSGSRVNIWDRSGNLIRGLEGFKYTLQCLAFSSEGDLLAGGSLVDFGKVAVWSLKTGRLVRKFTAHPRSVSCMGFLPGRI